VVRKDTALGFFLDGKSPTAFRRGGPMCPPGEATWYDITGNIQPISFFSGSIR